jgi:putative ABC transport system substrate-binding protein
MRPRALVVSGSAALVGWVSAWPGAADAQRPARIGYLASPSLEDRDRELRESFEAFRQELRHRGYVERQNLEIEYRGADGKFERFPALARELVALAPDLIVAAHTPAARALQQATSSIPIVVSVMGDPVGDGLVASLARPGGNITGLTFIGPQLAPKRLTLLKEALPAASRVAVLWHPGAYGERTMSDMVKETESVARTFAMELRFVAVAGPDELDRALAAIAGERFDALFVFPSPMLFAERRRIVEFATRHRLPSMSMGREFVELGGLMSYGANITDLNRRAAAYAVKILQGARPGDLPVEQPTKFELAVNLTTAKAFGLTIPPSIFGRADEIIE